jgi:hypothetical protein
MSEVAYEKVLCKHNLPGCQHDHAGYLRRMQFAHQGPWLDACESCARTPYQQPPQLQVAEDTTQGF